MPSATHLKHEKKALQEGFLFVIGVDEAGRGPLAGPVVAAAVSLKETKFCNKISDSKALTSLQRERAFHEILEKSYTGIGVVSESVIDASNILQATYHAMSIAVRKLFHQLAGEFPERILRHEDVCLLVDGNSFKTDLPFAYRTIVGGDALSLSIASASIVAKVTRDRILDTYDKIFPQYGFKRHKGYPTEDHKLAIQRHGLSLIHRKTFHSALDDR